MRLNHFVAVAACVCIPATLDPAPSQASPPVSLELRWTAPGDDGMVGSARTYVLRYSTAPITNANFNQARLVSGLPTPLPAGATESFVVTGLTPNMPYYFALKTADDVGNLSALSNVIYWSPLVVEVENPPPTLEFSTPWPNPARTLVRCSYALPEAAEFQVDVFDATGRRVRALARGALPAGRGAVEWDLHDDAGRRVSAGIYLMHARLAGGTWTRRVTVVP